MQNIIKMTEKQSQENESKNNIQEKLDNLSNKQVEHMRSAHVVLEHIKYYDCKQCSSVFFQQAKLTLHSVSHVKPVVDSNPDEGRFVKRFNCETCGAKFVLLSTLQLHQQGHAPHAHVCRCGVGFRARADLAAHQRLAHAAERARHAATLTYRQKRAFDNEVWIPTKKPKTEPPLDDSRTPKPRLRPTLKRKAPKRNAAVARNEAVLFPCPVCGKNFKEKRNVEIHQVVHTGEKPFACSKCDKRFTQLSSRSTHEKTHGTVREFGCEVCGKTFMLRSRLLRHAIIHSKVKPYVCEYCDKGFSDPSALGRHRRTHTGEKRYVCKYCLKGFTDVSALRAHVKNHEDKHECEICSSEFASQGGLRKHIWKCHSEEKNYVCELCHKAYSTKSDLAAHLARHQRATKHFECDHCCYVSAYKNNLAHHIHSMHSHNSKKRVNRNYKCGKCNQSFPSINELRAHRKLDCNVQCNICSKVFTKVRKLNRHMKIHVENNHCAETYECDYCGAQFNCKKTLTSHIFNLHLITVMCDICQGKFISGTALQVHKAKGCSYPCNYCGKGFTSKYFQAKHIMDMH